MFLQNIVGEVGDVDVPYRPLSSGFLMSLFGSENNSALALFEPEHNMNLIYFCL